MKILRLALIVLRKEVLDGVRDRRAILSTYLGLLIAPVLLVFVFNQVADIKRRADDLRLPVQGAENAPALIDWLGQQRGVEVEEAPEDPEAVVRAGDLDLVLVIPDDFGKQFSEVRPAEVQVIVDGSRARAGAAMQRLRGLLLGYGRQIGMLRMIARGVSPQLAATVDIKEVEVSSAQERIARTALNFVPMLLIIAAFVGGMHIAMDSTAGERERGSLEALLVNPVPRSALVLGKWMASICFSVAAVVLTGWSLSVVVRLMPSELGFRLSIGLEEWFHLVAAALPLALVAPGVQTMLATFARSYKEAQTYVPLLMFLPMAPGFISMFNPIQSESWMAFVPLLSQHVLLTDVLGGKTPGPSSFLIAGAVALALSLGFVALTARLFQRERIIFGR